MAIVWGSWSGQVRVGLNIVQSPAKVTADTSSVSYSVELWIHNARSGGVTTSSGLWTGSNAWKGKTWKASIFVGYGKQYKLSTSTYKIGLKFGQTQSLTIGHQVKTNANTTSSVSVPVTVPARPTTQVKAPIINSVTNAGGSGAKITWTNKDNYSSIVLERRIENGAWQEYKSLAGSATTYTDTALQSNTKYQYRVFGKNTYGSKGLVSSAISYFTKPVTPTFQVTRSGADSAEIVTVSAYPSWVTRFEVSRNGVTVGESVILAASGHSGAAWVDTNVPTGEVAYRIRPKVPVVGDWSAPVTLKEAGSPPAAPNVKIVNGQPFTFEGRDKSISWQHNPTDDSVQTAAQVRIRRYGEDWQPGEWTVFDVEGASTSVYTIPEVWRSGNIEIAVRTKGLNPSFGAWSGGIQLAFFETPDTQIVLPDDAGQSADLEFSIAFSTPFEPWFKWFVFDDNGVQVAFGNGQIGQPILVPNILANLRDYTIRVHTGHAFNRADYAITETVLSVNYAPPPAPSLFADFNEPTASATITYSQNPKPDGTYPPVKAVLYKSLDNGNTWEKILETDIGDSNGEFIDYTPNHNGLTVYKLENITADAAKSETIFECYGTGQGSYVNTGSRFENAAHLLYEPVCEIVQGWSRSVQVYEGRELPVAFSGSNRARAFKCTGLIVENDPNNTTLENLSEVFNDRAPVSLYRDDKNPRIYGVLSDLTISNKARTNDGWIWSYSFTITETEHGRKS